MPTRRSDQFRSGTDGDGFWEVRKSVIPRANFLREFRYSPWPIPQHSAKAQIWRGRVAQALVVSAEPSACAILVFARPTNRTD